MLGKGQGGILRHPSSKLLVCKCKKGKWKRRRISCTPFEKRIDIRYESNSGDRSVEEKAPSSIESTGDQKPKESSSVDQPTPSLMEDTDYAEEREDNNDDTNNALDYLDEFMGSLTHDETNRMLQGFASYVEHNHNGSTPSIASDGPSKLNTPRDYVYKSSSLRRWLKCNSTSHSVEGLYVHNGFEPSVDTLDGIRVTLFEWDW